MLTETLLSDKEYEEAISTIDSAVDGCKGLVEKLGKDVLLRKEYYARRRITIRQMVIVVGVIALFALIRLVWRRIKYKRLLKEISG